MKKIATRVLLTGLLISACLLVWSLWSQLRAPAREWMGFSLASTIHISIPLLLVGIMLLCVVCIPQLRKLLRNLQRTCEGEETDALRSGIFSDFRILMVACGLLGLLSPSVLQAQSCNCKEYIYLNEPAIGAVLKFEVGAGVLLTEVIGANGGTPPNQHWYPGLGSTELPLPHGLGTDLNGKLYIGNVIGPPSRFRQLDCDGKIAPINPNTITDPTGPNFNAFSIGNILYKTGNNEIRAYNTCTGAFLGSKPLAGGVNVTTPADGVLYWGLSYNKVTGMVYATQEAGYVWRMTVSELNDFTTPANPFISRGTGYPNPGDNFLPGGTARTEGIVGDNAGNIYIVTFTGGLLKYNASGGFVAGFLEGTVPQIGDTRGIIWSETYNRLFVSNQTDNPAVDCIAAFDPNSLAYLGAAAPNPNLPVDNRAKALAIIKECCPTNLPSTFNVNVCGGVGRKFFLNQEAFNSMTCMDGIVCGSSWVAQPGGTGMTFDPCDNSVTITGPGCTTFTLNISAVTSTSCPAQSATFTICNSVPTANVTFSQTPATCTGTGAVTPNNNGILTMTTASNATHYGISTLNAVAYNGAATILDATAIVSGSLPTNILTNIPNTGGTYIVRIFDATNAACYVDQVVNIAAVNCPPPCVFTVNSTTPLCHGNGTPENGSDDYITFTLNVANSLQGSRNYTITATQGGNPIVITLANGQPANAVNCNLNTPLRTPAGTAGGGPIVLTITDNVHGCITTANISDPGTCAVTCTPGTPSMVMYSYRTQTLITELNNEPIIIPQFDEMGGTRTLTSVKLEYGSGGYFSVLVESDAALQAQNFSITSSTDSEIKLNSNTLATLSLSSTSGPQTLPVGISVPAQGAWPGDVGGKTLDGMAWAQGVMTKLKDPRLDPRWVTTATGNLANDDDIYYMPVTQDEKTGMVTYTLATDLLPFKGNGNVPLEVSTLSGLTLQGGGGQIASSQATRGYAFAKVTYTYECVVAACALTPANLTINSSAFGPGAAPLAENVTTNGSFPLSENNIAGFNLASSAGAFYSFCVEIDQPLLPLQNPYTHELNNAANGFTPAVALRIAQVIQAAGFDNAMGFGAGNNTVTNFVALQMAVWNAIYDTDYTISAGNFQMLTDNNPGVRAVANAWLTAAQAITAPTVVVHRLHNASGQDLLKIGNVPANVTVSVTQPTCIGANSPNNGGITIGNFTNQRYQYSTGMAFNSGSAIPASITAIPVGGVIVSNLANTSQNYTVRIYDATDDNCYVDQTVTITEVNCACTNPILTDLTNQTICQGGSFTPANVTTSATNGVSVTYQWFDNNGANNPGTASIGGQMGAALMALPTTPGVYAYKVVATNSSDNTCFAEKTVTLTITLQVEAGTGGATTICETSTTTITLFSLITGGDAGGTWTAGVGNPSGGTFTAGTGTFNPTGATPGVYTFTYAFGAGGGCAADQTTVTVNVTEQREVGTGSSTNICATSTTVIDLFGLLADEETGGTWTAGVANPSGGTFTAGTATFDPTSASVGTYTFIYSFAATGNCAADQATVTVIVSNQPEAGTGSPTTICETSTSTITLSSLLTGGDAGGTWTAGVANPSGGTFTAASGTFDPTGASVGTYTFTYAFAAGGGCAADQTTVTVNVTEQKDAGNNGSTNICATSTTSITLFNLLTGTPDVGGTWTAGVANPSGGAFTAGTGTFNPTGASVGTYTFTYSFAATGGCVSDDATVTIIVNAQPDAGTGTTDKICFTSTSTITLADLLTGATTGGTWTASGSNPAGGTFTAAGGTFNPTGASIGTYTFTYAFAAAGGCAADDATVTIEVANTPDVCPTDFGDLPQPPYATDLTNTGPSHIIITGLKIGSMVDAETDGQPNGTATGDGADEDGFNPALPANMLIAGQTTTFTIPVMNMTGSNAKLTVYIDFNNDGDLTDANEMFSTTVANNATTATLSIVVPVDAVLNTNIGARFRLTTSTTMSPTGLAPDGEVEDYLVQVMGVDYGDLADSGAGTGTGNYETQSANGGASHKIITDPTTGVVTLKIGGSVDADTDGQQSATANGDDNATPPGADDEDGVTLPMFVTGTSFNIAVPVMNMTGGDAKLVMFVDWNNDGDFADTDEMYSVTVPNNATTATLNGVTPPLTAALNANFGIRFRLSNDPAFILNMLPNGPVTGGEVEDYIAQSMGFDYGDLNDVATGTGGTSATPTTPADHATLLVNDGPRHKIVTDVNGAVTLKIGASVDDDANGQPSADAGKTAGGDDNTGTPDDEELEAYLATKLFIVTQNTTLDIPVMNMTGSTAKLTLFIDFNKDGDFTDSGEMFSDEVNSGETVANLTVTVPSYAVVGQDLGFRLRLAGVTDIMTPTGAAQSGEVEDYMIQVIGYDYGDLPTTYGTEDPNAPKHILDANLKLGASVDAELNGAPEAMAGAMTGGDDNTAGLVTFGTSNPANDDENGVVFVTPMVPGSQACIEVTAMNMNNTAAVLQMWIDWNGDGDILDAGEAVTTGSFNGAGGGAVVPATSGLTNAKLCFDVPAGAVFADGGAAFVRFRLSPSGGLAPNTQTGPVPFGEIEDYKVQLGKVGNLVFEDRDFDGTQDAGEPGIPGVTVSLTWVGPDGVLGGTDDVTYPTVQTDANGKYYFCGLTDGPGASDNQFKLVFSTPANMTPTRTNQGSQTDGGVADSDGAVTLSPTMDLTMAMETFAFVFPTPLSENSTGDSGTPGVGNFDDNQTDETHDQGFALLDYGDLPEDGNGDDFSTTMTNGGAVHVITPGLKLGASVDGERDGTPSADASGDGADEDGIRFLTPLIPGNLASIEISTMNSTGSQAQLQGWIDWNGNGQLEPAEQLGYLYPGGGAVIPYPVPTGNQVVVMNISVPSDATFNDGMVFARFRLSPTGGLNANGPDKYGTDPVPQGEVEDYKLNVGKIGNLVFEDRNFNGVQDLGEPGINGVTVSLIWAGANGTIGTGGDDVTYTSLTTGTGFDQGEYYFCGLTPGTYKIVYTTPTDMTPTRTNQGSQTNGGTLDSDGAVTLAPTMDLTMAMETFTIGDVTTLPTAENGTGDNGTNPTGTFPDNQTDETHDQGFAFLDYGDLPEDGNGDDFSTRMTNGGAVHVITPGFKLGASIDGERDGAPSADASGDGADEDGVTFTSPLIPGNNATISVVSMNPFTNTARLQGWIDWNNSGTLEAGEALAFTSNVIPTGNATTTFTFPVPSTAIFNDGMVFARFRLSPTGGLNANGPDKYGTDPVPQGEVEDYKLNVVKVGNLVWEDYDFDGIQDAGEPGIGGQTVQLVWGGPDGDVTTTSDNETYSTTTLAAAAGGNLIGEYYFCGLIEGTYKLVALTPTDMTPSKSNQGDQTNGGLTDNDGIQTGTDLTMIMTAPFTITPANLTNQPTGENSTGDNGTAGVGTFPDRQTNETYDFAFVSVDFGDLPDSYTTNDDPNDSGAQHITQPGKYLGTCVDAERDAAVDALAGLRGAGDDGAASTRTQGTCTTPNDDENGVEFLTPLVPGYEACVRVTYTAIDQAGLIRDGKTYLSAWIDYNGNGQFDNGEKAISDLALTVGTNVVRDLCFTVPSTATFAGGAIRARFRLHCEPGLGSAGVAIGGEVEDYHLPIAKVGNYAWYDNDLRGDQTTTDNPRNFADEKGANGLSLVLVWYGPDGQFDTNDDRLYVKQTASGTQGELEDEGGTADGIYYFCGLQEGSFRIVPLKYATPANVGTTTVSTAGGTVYNLSDAAQISDGTTTTIREEFEISRKMLTRVNNVGDDELDSDSDPVLNFSIPNLVADGLITGENGVGDVPTVYNYPDTLTNLSLDLGLIQEPNIEIVQSVVGVDKAASKDCDNFNMIVDVCIKNTGISADGTMGVPLNNIQASIDLAGQLGAIFKGMVGKPVLIKTDAERKYAGDPLVDPQGFPVLNPNFNGSSNQNLFDGISGLLWPGEKILVRYVIEVAPNDVDMMTAVNAKWSATSTGAAVNYQGQPILNYYQGGIQYIAQDLSNDARTIEGGYYDADEPTPFGDCWKKVKQTVTMTTVNIGLHADCKLNVLPTMLIEPYYPECDTVGLPLGGFYRFIFADMNGKPLPNPIDARCLAQMKAKYLLELVGVCEPRWGEITFEDKAGPNIVSAVFAPDSILCKDVNLILNNPKSIGLPGTDFRSPRQNERTFGARNITLVNDELMNLGMVDFRENCDCDNACAVTVKWTDKLETYGCDSINIKGVWGRIYREWVATDCRGMRKDTVQVIVIKRPEVDAFKFVNTTRTGVKTQTGTAAGAPNYDWTVEYNSCTPDKSLIKKEDWMPSLLSKFHNPPSLPLRHYLDAFECNYSTQIKDTEFPICGGKGVKIDRELYIFDWCAGGIIDTIHILIKIGDFEAPSLEYAHHAPNALSTGPMDCTAAFPISVAGIKSTFGVAVIDNCGVANVSVRVKTQDRYVKGILVAPNTWEQVEYAVMNGMMTGLPVGRHRLIIDAYDGCYNAARDSFEFEVVDKIAPVMKCDDDLHVTLSNANGYTNGYAQVSADDIDEGSTDNCKLAWVRVRRNVPANCTSSFITKGYDTNGNGKLDPMPADGDWTKADGIDLNGDGDLADFGETFILKEGKLMTPLQDIVEFFCCDLAERVTIELWGEDTNGNRNFCWNDILIEDKVAPTCVAPWDVTIYCDDKGLEKVDDRTVSSVLWGDVTVSSGADCAALDVVYSTVKKLKCGAGYIDRIWTLTKQTAKGPITITCTQRITILPVREYNICFPKDANFDCKTPIIDTVLVDELGCDILAVNVSDKRYNASDDECYKIFRTYTVINWCVYDDRCGDPMAEGNVYVVNRGLFENYGKDPIYVLVRDNDRDGDEEFFLSKNLVVNEALSSDRKSGDYHVLGDPDRNGNEDGSGYRSTANGTMPVCTATGEYYHSFMYTQIIKVYDSELPVVTGIRDTFCTDAAACAASITKVVTIKDNCTDKVELERGMLMIAPFQTLDAGAMIMYATPRWSVKDLGKGQFEIKVSNLPEGLHDLIVVGRDECGNLSVATRIPFVVKDCKAPAPICINGLSTELMPDGNGGGMMAVWASDFVASKIYDCNGQGPETQNGLKLITKYSINRVGSPVVSTQTGINLTCADAGKVVLVELHAWDNAGNHDFCVTFIEVQDNRKVCGGNATLGEISGVITTDELKPVLGVNVDLSGGAQLNQNTGSNGVYLFGNLSKGSDYTVSPQLDKDHINGVSTFDLVQIQKHILGVKAIDNPYRMIAADVNNSKSISTIDMIQIRKLILNIDTKFGSVPSWKFVDASYKFPDPSNPWSVPFPKVANVNDLEGKVKADFIAIKMGDVNGNASVNGSVAVETRGDKAMLISTDEQQLQSGQSYTVVFKAKDLAKIQGYQFTLNIDPSLATIQGIDYSGVMKAEHFGLFAKDGMITTSYVRAPLSGAPSLAGAPVGNAGGETILFTLTLKAINNAALSRALHLNSRLTNVEAYNQSDEVMGVQLAFGAEAVAERAALRQNVPNPFSEETMVGFYLPVATKAVLTIRDVKGALIYRVEGNYAKGNNQVMLKKNELGASGVLYYTLETSDFTATKKMVVLQK